MKISLLISTYNWPSALNLVLKSVMAQSKIPDEILIADDGSGKETANLIEKFKAETKINIVHIWQEDEGFRRTSILNKAIAVATGDYIIQIDGDCIMHRKFVEDHFHHIKKDTFLFGSRVNIQQEYLDYLFSSEKIDFSFFTKGISKRTRNLHISIFNSLYKEKNELSRKLRGCNLSFWREDFIKINGYNEDMTGWGKEDSEMVVRLLNNNILGRRLRYKAIIYHIWHKESSREKRNINTEIQQKAIDLKLKRCENGIDKYL